MANKKDLATALIGTAINTSATTLVLQTGYGAGMPAVPFFMTLTPNGQLSTMGNSEIISVTARSTDTLTIVRAQKGTTAKSFAIGDVAANGVYVDDVPKDYSTSEVDTGMKYIDGRTIYRKTVEGVLNIQPGTMTMAHGISGLTNAYQFLRIDGGYKIGVATNNSSGTQTFMYRETGGNWVNLTSHNTTTLGFAGSFAWGNSYTWATIEYVK